MTHASYPSDITDAQWAAIRDSLSTPRDGSRPRRYEVRDLVDAALYIQRTGCPWRLLPHDFPPWRTVYYHQRRWLRTGAWDRALAAMHQRQRPVAARLSKVGRKSDGA